MQIPKHPYGSRKREDTRPQKPVLADNRDAGSRSSLDRFMDKMLKISIWTLCILGIPIIIFALFNTGPESRVNNGDSTDYISGFSKGFSSTPATSKTPAVNVYPSETQRVSVTGTVIEAEVSKDQWDRQTIVLGVANEQGVYICKFPHEEAKRLFGQIAALITQGNAKAFMITLSGLPADNPSYKKNGMTLLEKCQFTHWRII